ncbi:hypothetical protein [Hymenobacter sp. CRA2]|uniref:hypothetical protein n=1 Tax=Hymenobacter sp. CRA2 TaxID=1955620 RepID=UPI00098F7CDB|nr:hypothetical protein [Hymenobacter sp. CRA2]OON71014.1 hypothetical protein B0919_03180 [Hymenobacter sp. CRA2]
MLTLPITIATCTAFFSTLVPLANNPDTDIAFIRQQYAATRQALPTMRRRRIDLLDWSTEGAAATGYFQRQELRLVEADVYGEMGQMHTGYYFAQGQLIFVLERAQNYAVHLQQRPSLAGSTRSTRRYYFSEGCLVRWLQDQNQAVPTSVSAYPQKQQQLLAEAQELQQLLAKPPAR